MRRDTMEKLSEVVDSVHNVVNLSEYQGLADKRDILARRAARRVESARELSEEERVELNRVKFRQLVVNDMATDPDRGDIERKIAEFSVPTLLKLFREIHD